MTTQFKTGQKLKFVGYSQQPDDPYFQAGETIEVAALDNEGSPMCFGLNEDGTKRADGVTELLWPEEVEVIAEGETGDEVSGEDPVSAAEAAEDAAPAAPKAKGKKGKAAAVKKDPTISVNSPEKITPVVPMDNGVVLAPPSPTLEGGARSELVRAAISSVSHDDGETESTSALKAAKSLIDQVEKTYYTLGGVLAFIKETGAYKALGFNGKRGFAEYCASELDTDYRKAKYLIEIYEVVQAAGLNEERISALGWSKAKEIIRVGKDISLDKLSEDFETLVSFAETNTRDNLISHIKTNYVGIKTREAAETVQVSSFVFKLSADQATVANQALSSAKTLAQTDDLSVAFAFILNDWQMMNEGSDITLESALAVMEHRFNVSLAVGEPAAAEEPDVQESAAVTA